MTSNGDLEFQDVILTRDGQRLLTLSATVAPGETLSIMGPSGSGKSTLLAMATGTISPEFDTSGRIILGGRDITALPPQDRQVGILFQDDVLFPHLSVRGNLAFGLHPSVKGRKARMAAVDEALAGVGLAGFADRDPATLSGGQRARVALMRVLLSQPKALLLDEPFSKLDAGLRDQIRNLVFDHARAAGLPVVLVTHDPEDAKAAGGRVITVGG